MNPDENAMGQGKAAPALRLSTPRLLLRPYRQSDFSALLRVAADADTVRYLFFWGRDGIAPEDDAKRFLAHARAAAEAAPRKAMEYALTLRDGGQVIGGGSLERLSAGEGEIGWVLLPEYRGRGYVHEMAGELIRHGFEDMGLERIIACCDNRNAPSYRVMARLGMTVASIQRGARPAKRPGEENGDERVCALTRADWESGQNRRL